ncbi:hypothetical protein CR513_23082, partial [Mucuna pruriens]
MGNDGVSKLWLRGVRHALDVHFNLISMDMLDNGGYDNHFLVMENENSPKDMFPRLKNIESEKCSHCMTASSLKKSKLLELVHSNVCGSLKGETLYTTIHVINLSLVVVLNTEVPNNILFGKDIKYDHLRVFGCKAFLHYIFIGYGHNEYDYKLYNPVKKKLVRSHYVQFMGDQTIEDINMVKKTTLEKDNSLSEIDLVRMSMFFIFLLMMMLKKNKRCYKRQSSTRYPSNEYVTLTDGEEP